MAMMQEILTIEISLRFDNDCTATVGVGYLPTYLPSFQRACVCKHFAIYVKNEMDRTNRRVPRLLQLND